MLTMILPFILAQLLLLVAIWIGLRIAAREPRLAGRLAAITEITHRPTRVEAGRKEATRTRTEVDAVDKRLARARQRLADLIPMPESPASVVGFSVLTFILFEGEAAVALLLNLAARLGDMTEGVAAFLSPLAAAALFAALHVILGAIISLGAQHRPQRVVLRAKIGAALIGSLVLAAAWAVLSGRSFSDPQFVETVASWGLMVLALLLSIAGAFAALVVSTLRDERALEHRVVRLEQTRTALERHLEAVQRDLAQHDEAPVDSPHDSKVRTLVSGLIAALLLPIAGAAAEADPVSRLVVAPTSAPATTGSPAAAATAAAGPGRTSLIGLGSCEQLLDVSRSVDPTGTRHAVDQLATDLETVMTLFGCSIIRVSPFSGEAPFNVVREVAVPPIPTTSLCPNASSSGQLPTTKRAVGMLYPRVATAQQEDAVRTCLATQQAQRDGALGERAAALRAGRQLLRDALQASPKGSCTALHFAVERAVRRSQHVLALTDGAETCATTGQTLGALAPGQTLTFLLLPTAAPNANHEALRLARRLEAVYPMARVVFFAELTPSLWGSLRPPTP